jgi:starch synthase
MRIIIASSEAVPYAKTGGLADVTGSLLREFRGCNENASLILPLYSVVKKTHKLYKTGKSVSVVMGDLVLKGNILVSEKSESPAAYFIDCGDLYERPELYGTSSGDYPDNSLRFIFFSRAVLETCITMNIKPDIIHCNDWQTALLPLFLKEFFKSQGNLMNTATLHTIHNLGYEGLFPASDMKYTGLSWDYFISDRLEFYGKLNFMKAGILYADLINSVSPTYAKEILSREKGFGLEGVLRKRKDNLYGILNGIDISEWNPANDEHIPKFYDADTISGKEFCKKELLNRTGLKNPDMPLIGIVSRLASQKGIDLLINSFDILIALGANIVVLGRGDEYFQKLLTEMAERYRGRVYVKIGFNENLAHLIYAGCDFFLMPSKYEPCGLGQMIAMRYGTVPIARKTGGLADTIADYDHLSSKGTGFLFSDYTPASLQDSIKRAFCVFTDKEKLKKMASDAMKTDFSWTISARKYLELYDKACRKVSR